jgi:hypothetical protein
MFGTRYFAPRFFNGRYFDKGGTGAPPVAAPVLTSRLTITIGPSI